MTYRTGWHSLPNELIIRILGYCIFETDDQPDEILSMPNFAPEVFAISQATRINALEVVSKEYTICNLIIHSCRANSPKLGLPARLKSPLLERLCDHFADQISLLTIEAGCWKSGLEVHTKHRYPFIVTSSTSTTVLQILASFSSMFREIYFTCAPASLYRRQAMYMFMDDCSYLIKGMQEYGVVVAKGSAKDATDPNYVKARVFQDLLPRLAFPPTSTNSIIGDAHISIQQFVECLENEVPLYTLFHAIDSAVARLHTRGPVVLRSSRYRCFENIQEQKIYSYLARLLALWFASLSHVMLFNENSTRYQCHTALYKWYNGVGLDLYLKNTRMIQVYALDEDTRAENQAVVSAVLAQQAYFYLALARAATLNTNDPHEVRDFGPQIHRPTIKLALELRGQRLRPYIGRSPELFVDYGAVPAWYYQEPLTFIHQARAIAEIFLEGARDAEITDEGYLTHWKYHFDRDCDHFESAIFEERTIHEAALFEPVFSGISEFDFTGLIGYMP